MKITLTENSFSVALDSSRPVLVHFSSDFCGPCKVQSRVLEQMEDKYKEKIVLGEINTHNQSDFAEAFGIRSTPTVLIIYRGKVLARLTGVHSLSKIEQIISETGVLN